MAAITIQIAVDITKWNQKKIEIAVPDPEAEPIVEPPAAVPVHFDEDSFLRLPLTSVMPWLNIKSSIKPSREDSSLHASISADRPISLSAPPEGLEYADLSDPKVPKCLLCQRQFKSLEILQKHSSQSELHKVRCK